MYIRKKNLGPYPIFVVLKYFMKVKLLTSLVLLTTTLAAETHSAMTIRHRESNGVGYNQGYSTLDYYLTSQFDDLEFLFNVRGHLFNNAKAAGNAGIGFRYSLNEDDSRIGMNLYYDFRDTNHFFAHQAAAGFEWISHIVDVRVNGYVPVGKQQNFHHKRFQGFTGNRVIIRNKYTAALPCVEGEIGTPIARPFYFAAGSYYLFQEKAHGMQVGNALGGKVRFDFDIGSYFTAGAMVTYDKIFKTRVQGYVAINITLGPWKSMKDSCTNLEKRRIIRNEIIPIQSKKQSKDILTASKKQNAVQFVFVNNTAEPLGDGTFEHPFVSLKEAEAHSSPGDVIYVYPGDGTPHFMDEGIILQPEQELASSGAPLEVNEVVIPAQTPGQNPVVTNIHPNEPVVTNPGSSNLSNFYYMNPWEYMGMYDAPSYNFDSPSFSPGIPHSSSDTALSDWVSMDNSVTAAEAAEASVAPAGAAEASGQDSGGLDIIHDYWGHGKQ